jgi:hypothetical protein
MAVTDWNFGAHGPEILTDVGTVGMKRTIGYTVLTADFGSGYFAQVRTGLEMRKWSLTWADTKHSITEQPHKVIPLYDDGTIVEGPSAGQPLTYVINPDPYGQIPIYNWGFETPLVPDDTGIFPSPAGASWNFAAGSAGGAGVVQGLRYSSSMSPEGVQAGYIQKTGAISQALTGFVQGSQYNLRFWTAQQMPGQVAHDFDVYLDPIVNFGRITPASHIYQQVTIPFTAGATQMILRFQGTNSNGADVASLIDQVAIGPVNPTPGALITNATYGDYQSRMKYLQRFFGRRMTSPVTPFVFVDPAERGGLVWEEPYNYASAYKWLVRLVNPEQVFTQGRRSNLWSFSLDIVEVRPGYY